MSQTTVLAAGEITQSDSLSVELVQPSETPPVILLRWPTQPTITDPYRFPAVINRVMSVLAAAAGKLATIRGSDS